MYGISFIGNIFGNDEAIIKEKLESIDVLNATKILDINVSSSNITIKLGTTLRAETNNSNISCKQNNQNLQIKEKNHNWFSNNENSFFIASLSSGVIFLAPG